MDTYNLLPENEYKVAEDRRYLNPNLQVDATNKFIDNLRSNQQANNTQITMQTRNLGTQVPSNLGGLTGGTGYFTSRYQTPQTNAATQNLRTAAQAAALNQALANEKAYWQKRYQDAYRAQQKSAYDKANTPATQTLGGVDYEDTSEPTTDEWKLTANAGETVVAEPDGQGGTTGRIFVQKADGTGEWRNQNIRYRSDDAMGRHAGADQLSDLVTGMYNYTLPDGREVELGGWDESLKVGSDGNYYIWNSTNNSYTPIYGASGKTSGGGRWWTK